MTAAVSFAHQSRFRLRPGNAIPTMVGKVPSLQGQGFTMSIKTAPTTVSNDEAYLEVQMQSRLGHRIRDLRVLVLPDGVILQGRATTYHAKQLAQHAVMELSTLPILANDIEVF
jgi:hypothetical protein